MAGRASFVGAVAQAIGVPPEELNACFGKTADVDTRRVDFTWDEEGVKDGGNTVVTKDVIKNIFESLQEARSGLLEKGEPLQPQASSTGASFEGRQTGYETTNESGETTFFGALLKHMIEKIKIKKPNYVAAEKTVEKKGGGTQPSSIFAEFKRGNLELDSEFQKLYEVYDEIINKKAYTNIQIKNILNSADGDDNTRKTISAQLKRALEEFVLRKQINDNGGPVLPVRDGMVDLLHQVSTQHLEATMYLRAAAYNANGRKGLYPSTWEACRAYSNIS